MENNQSAINDMLVYSNFINELFQPLFNQLGFQNFIYNEFHADGRLLILNSNGQFLKDKFENGFVKRLPKIILQDYNKMGFHFHNEQAHDKLLDDDEDYNLIKSKYNYSNPLRYFVFDDTDEKSIIKQYALYSSFSTSSTCYNALNYKDEILGFFKNFDKRFIYTLQNMPLIQTAPLNFENIKKNQQDALEIKNSVGVKVSYVGISSPPKKTKPVNLLKAKEKLILSKLFQGYTISDIATQLNLSIHTIHSYLYILRTRFECKTNYEIIYKLLSEGVNLED